jgi:hypothetical protein
MADCVKFDGSIGEDGDSDNFPWRLFFYFKPQNQGDFFITSQVNMASLV